MPKLTFILPVYKVEKYLPRVFASLKAQSERDWEAIFVDDGSPDNSGKLCEQLALGDDRFIILHQQNKGQGAARNVALNIASGDYISFIDSDDYIESDMAEELLALAYENDADMVWFGKTEEWQDDELNIASSYKRLPCIEGVFKDNPFQTHFKEFCTSYFVTDKIFKREGLTGIHFPNYRLGEDALFYINYYKNNPQTVVVTQKPYYHYTRHEGSAVVSFHEFRVDNNFLISNALRDVITAWGKQNDPYFVEEAHYSTVRDLQLGITNICLSSKPRREKVLWLKKVLKIEPVKEAVKHMPLSRMASFNDKIKLVLFKLKFCGLAVLLSELNHK